jgi:hypothetical protein
MRTSLTLDDDVAAMIEQLRREKGLGLEEIVNEALREGLSRLTSEPAVASFATESVSLGRCLLGDLDDIADALAVAEGESHR